MRRASLNVIILVLIGSFQLSLTAQELYINLQTSTPMSIALDGVPISEKKIRIDGSIAHQFLFNGTHSFQTKVVEEGNCFYLLEKDQWNAYHLYYRGEFLGEQEQYAVVSTEGFRDSLIASPIAFNEEKTEGSDKNVMEESTIPVPITDLIFDEESFLKQLSEQPHEFEKLNLILEEGMKGTWSEDLIMKVANGLEYDPSKLQMFMELKKTYPNYNWKKMSSCFQFESTKNNFLEWLNQIQ